MGTCACCPCALWFDGIIFLIGFCECCQLLWAIDLTLSWQWGLQDLLCSSPLPSLSLWRGHEGHCSNWKPRTSRKGKKKHWKPKNFLLIFYTFFKMLKLQAAIKYGEEDLAGAKSLVDQCPSDDPDTDINRGNDLIIYN